MNIEIKRPTQTIQIVTDLVAMQASIKAASDYLDLKNKISGDNPTVSEAAVNEQGETLDELYQKMSKLKEQTDDSTISITLQGLNASQWRQLSLKHLTVNDDGNNVQDLPAQVEEAIPLMMVEAHDKSGSPINRDNITKLVKELTDSQLADIMIICQNLNDPVTELPKEISQLLSQPSRA